MEYATRAFWTGGYQGTSVRELMSACRIVPTSLYSEFGDKAGLFMAVVRHYIDEHDAWYGIVLDGDPPGMDRIRAHFDRYRYSASFRGCLLVNSLAERAHLPDEALGEIDAFFERVRLRFQRNISPCVDEAIAVQRASVLLTFDIGLSSVGKLPGQRESLRLTVDHLLSLLAGNQKHRVVPE